MLIKLKQVYYLDLWKYTIILKRKDNWNLLRLIIIYI
jgi:hypothetical protein